MNTLNVAFFFIMTKLMASLTICDILNSETHDFAWVLQTSSGTGPWMRSGIRVSSNDLGQWKEKKTGTEIMD